MGLTGPVVAVAGLVPPGMPPPDADMLEAELSGSLSDMSLSDGIETVSSKKSEGRTKDRGLLGP